MPHFFVEGTPRPQGSKRHIGNGRMIESSKYLPAWRKQVTLEARKWATKNGFTPYPKDTPVRLQLIFVMPRPKRLKQDENPPMTKRPDSDKLERAIKDALTGIIYEDDSQVTHDSKIKNYARHGETPGVHIVFGEVRHDLF